MKKYWLLIMFVFVFLVLSCPLRAAPASMGISDPNRLTIYEIQYTTDTFGDSSYKDQVIGCRGGIVTNKFYRRGGIPRINLQDPEFNSGWGGVTVKDFTLGELYDNVNVGDWLSVKNTRIEESRGNTQLNYTDYRSPNPGYPGDLGDPESSFTVESTGNHLPPYKIVSPENIVAPVWDYAQAFVPHHRAEKYEGMRLRVFDVIVTHIDLGKAGDNYTLQWAPRPADPNSRCWAADYMNIDKSSRIDKYHPYIELDRHFCSVSGILEQYTKLSDDWDYYQLLTLDTENLGIPQPADFDEDCVVNLRDLFFFAQRWLQDNCNEPLWCDGADLTRNEPNGVVDTDDLIEFTQHWLNGK